MLPHTVTLAKEVPAQGDFWEENTETAEEETLRYVKMEPSTKIIRDKNNVEIQLAATLFYDCRNSLPRGIEFAVDDVVIFNGQRHQVKVVEPLYDGRKLHHYESGLIKRA